MASFFSSILTSGLALSSTLTNGFLNPFQKSFQASEINAIDATCRVIAQTVSSESDVHWPKTSNYDTDIYHWAVSAREEARCSVRPGNVDDLSKILQIIGWTKTPFAVTGGGHALNPGFSSTEGIHIAMSKFREFKHNEEANTVDIGAGLRWNDVYGPLNPKGHTVVGGRVNGVGVAGFILGGGLSWTTNERGLTIDTLVSCEIVLPNGTVTSASADVNPDLFFGLKGGLNNFGIVTKFTLQVFPQTDIWGGAVIVPETDIEQANTAITNFANNVRDPKATMNIIFEYAEGEMNALVIVFYNAPQPPAGMFDEVLNIKNGNVQVASMPFLSLLDAGQPRNTPRRIQDVAPIQTFSPSILRKIANETKFWGSYLEKHHSGHFFDYVVEVFLPDYFSHGPDSAWPADRSVVHYPIDIAFAWYDEKHDAAVHDALKQSVAQIRLDAAAEGQSLEGASLYPNLAIIGTPLEDMYGKKHLEKLKEIRDVYDPKRVMDQSGSWHF